jgi:hypothetical protein
MPLALLVLSLFFGSCVVAKLFITLRRFPTASLRACFFGRQCSMQLYHNGVLISTTHLLRCRGQTFMMETR